MKNFNSILYKILGSRIKAQREALNMNQIELGEKAEIGRTSISNIEQGRQKPPLSVIYRICHELGADVRTILPTHLEIEHKIAQTKSEGSLEKFFEMYDLDEKTKKDIDDLFKDKN
ncbi:helix-turn-helix domain-containing protein [Flavobacterium sp. P21]|uniref:helix-turn-helix domain-containing protein n=1 Tax=Flavobacterium sp. P21 TaxID=3423948 RepID=UPI003D66BD1B